MLHAMARLGRNFALMLAALTAFTAPVRAGAPVEAVKDWTGRGDPSQGRFAAGAAVFKAGCANCHAVGGGRVPPLALLQDMTPAAVHRALTEGVMRQQGAKLNEQERIAVAEFVANRAYVAPGANPPANMCKGARAKFDYANPPVFPGWGLDASNTREVPARLAGITRRNVGRLKLKWAYAFPDSQRMRSQPALAGGALILGNHTGAVQALDAETGCVRWSYDASAEVRTGVVVGPWKKGDRKAKPLAWFGDVRGNVYAVDAATGAQVWKVAADRHPSTVMTGTPTHHQGVLYVPVSSIEEASAAVEGYACCTFRGSILALDAATGKQLWRTYTVAESKKPSPGQEQWGPSGVAVWNSPAIDAKRGQLYFTTGDNYTHPTTDLSDSIVAMDLRTGAIRWHYQATTGDAWNVGCYAVASGNCPEDAGPDFDFGAAAVLAKGSDGRERLLAGQKSGIVYALDPDSGALLWQTRAGKGSAGGGVVFGMAASSGRLFAPMFDMDDGTKGDFPAKPGLHALDVATGRIAWQALSPQVCAGRPGCRDGNAGAATVANGLVYAGSEDGHLRIYDAADGKVMWDFDTVVDIATVNGVPGRGGSISGGAGPLVYGNRLIAVSGYGFASRMPGNVLMVFEAK